MSDNVFIDSNVFLYALSDQDIKKHQVAKRLILQDSVSISTQVINEVANNLPKKFQFSEVEIAKFIRSSFQRYRVTQLTEAVLLAASRLRQEHNFSYWYGYLRRSPLHDHLGTAPVSKQIRTDSRAMHET